jgi:predicted lipid-binding transport protein (Tim44 family)
VKLLIRRRDAALAEQRLRRERDIWHIETTTIRARIARHRAAFAAGGGLASGLLCGLVPPRSVARLGRFFAGTVSFALRTSIGAMLVEGATRRVRAEAPPGPPENAV